MPNGDNYTDTLPPQQQTTDALMLLWKEIGEEYDVGTYDEFKEYLSNDDNRKSFYEGVIEPAYEIESQEKFESIYDLKKKRRGFRFSWGGRSYYIGYRRSGDNYALGVFSFAA